MAENNATDVTFGQLAVRHRFASAEQVTECIEIQRKSAGQGRSLRLGEIMVEKGYLTKDQVETLSKFQQGVQPLPQIPGYEFMSKLGQGGMGSVFKARQVSMDRIVAVKILPPRFAKDKTFVDRFIREARAVAKLNHENIILGIDVGEHMGFHYFVMEYIEGETVQAILKREKKIDEKRALSIVLQVAKALDHAHKHYMVHRDVKPDNVMLTRDGTAKLCDLGLAKQTHGDSSLTQAGNAVGTPHYISPEQARGEDNVDIRSDIYSLGASLYHMVTGERPFDGPTPTVVMTKHVTEDLIPPRQRNPLISERASLVITKMMAKRREDRYQTPAELMTDFQNLIAGKAPVSAKAGLQQASVLPRIADAGPRPAPAAYGRRSGFPTGLALAAVVVIAMAAGVFVFVFRGRNTPEHAPVGLPEEPQTKPAKPSDPNNGGNPTGPVVDAEEKKAREWFDDDVALQKRNVGDPSKAIETIDAWNSFIDAHRATSWAEKGRTELDGFKAFLEQAAQEILTRKKGEVDALVGFGNFLGAIEVLRKDFPKEYLTLTAVGKKIEEEIGAIRDLMMEKFRNDMLSVDALEKEKKYDEAVVVCEAARKYVDPAKFDDIDARIGALREAGKNRLAEAQAEAARQCEELRKNLKAALVKRDYAGAKGLCSAAEKLECYKWMRDFVVAFVQDITWLEDLMRDCRQGADRLADAEQKTVISLRSGKVMLVRDKDKICQRCIENNNAIIGLNFDVLSDDDVILIAGYALSAKDPVRHMKFGLRHYYGKSTAKAKEQLNKAKDAGIERAAVYLDWIEQADMTDADRAAKKLYDEACAAFAAENWAEATRMFTELTQNHFNTDFYKRVKDDVKKKLAEASKKAESPDGLLAKRFPKAKIEALDRGVFRISYDFADPEQRKEWIKGKLLGQPSQADWAVDKNAGVLRGDGRGVLLWKCAFMGDMILEFTLITDSDRNIGAEVCASLDKVDSYALFFGIELPQAGQLDLRPVMLFNLHPEFPFLDPVGRADEPKLAGDGKRYKVRFARVAGTLTVSVDDKQILSEKHDKLRGGMVALVLNRARAAFDDVRITGVPDINSLKAPEPKEPVQGPGPDDGPPPDDGGKPGGRPGGPGKDPG